MYNYITLLLFIFETKILLPFSFVDYGVMLEINDLQYLPDGRSFLDCVGGRRFKVITSNLVNTTSIVDY